jgi:hypothetical protein
MATSVAAIALVLVAGAIIGLAVQFGSVARRRRRFRPLAPEHERLVAEPLDRI